MVHRMQNVTFIIIFNQVLMRAYLSGYLERNVLVVSIITGITKK